VSFPLANLGDEYVASLSQGSCSVSQKVRFPDQRSAAKALELSRYRASRERRRREVRAYFCGSCGGWHLSSQAEWVD
jgi:hypothetical protein